MNAVEDVARYGRSTRVAVIFFCRHLSRLDKRTLAQGPVIIPFSSGYLITNLCLIGR
jgi:hypothetical protein